jgi:hypothetical protein
VQTIEYRVKLHHRLIRAEPFFSLVMAGYLLLSVFEHPLWCYGHQTCGDVGLPRTLPVELQLSIEASLLLELACVIVFLFKQWATFRYMGSVVYLKHKWNLVVVILLLADISGLISSYMSPTDLTLWNPIVRPLVSQPTHTSSLLTKCVDF